jgi:hypothetical protein
MNSFNLGSNNLGYRLGSNSFGTYKLGSNSFWPNCLRTNSLWPSSLRHNSSQYSSGDYPYSSNSFTVYVSKLSHVFLVNAHILCVPFCRAEGKYTFLLDGDIFMAWEMHCAGGGGKGRGRGCISLRNNMSSQHPLKSRSDTGRILVLTLILKILVISQEKFQFFQFKKFRLFHWLKVIVVLPLQKKFYL